MKLTKELFEDVVAYIFAEPGAMGASGVIECLKVTGDTFNVCYLDEETNWELIKENFAAINGCKFNGPHRKAYYSANVLVLGGNDDIVTTINDGWREICFDCGNHFVCKEEYARGFIKFFEGMDGCQIICDGMEKIQDEHFVEKLDSIEKEYYEQKEKDEELARKLKELNENPKYRERIKNCGREQGVDAMLEVAKEFGLDITFMELKQFGLRQQGIL